MTGELLVDPCLVLDVLENDPRYGHSSAALIDKYANGGLTLSPVAYLELAPAFAGNRTLQDEFLGKLGISVKCVFPESDLPPLHRRWARCVEEAAASGRAQPSFVAFINGACALTAEGLLTRRVELYRSLFPTLNLVTE